MEVAKIGWGVGYECVLVAEEKECGGQGGVQVVETAGPWLLGSRVGCKSRSDRGRPITTRLENKYALMDFMSHKS